MFSWTNVTSAIFLARGYLGKKLRHWKKPSKTKVWIFFVVKMSYIAGSLNLSKAREIVTQENHFPNRSLEEFSKPMLKRNKVIFIFLQASSAKNDNDVLKYSKRSFTGNKHVATTAPFHRFHLFDDPHGNDVAATFTTSKIQPNTILQFFSDIAPGTPVISYVQTEWLPG